MPARPWFGLMRGLLFALWPGMQFPSAAATSLPWRVASLQRRRVFLALLVSMAGVAVALQWHVAPETPSFAWWLQALLVTLLFSWVSVGLATALMGAWVLWRGDPHGIALREPHAPIDRAARTALIMPICNENVATVFAGLRATCESLAATGALPLFDIYVLSDTSDPALRAAEQQAWQRLRQTLGDKPVGAGGRVFYRWRRRRTRRKAGNVADFCRRWGGGYRYMVVLDADSIMHGDTLVSLVRLMEQNPRAGIVQTLPQGFGHGTAHARLQQFASRVTGRVFALGMAYWQLGESHYWGHNAILRVAPFMRHCGLAPIPGRGGLAGEILSHDFVEAAMMCRAGHEVWLAPQLQGSWEQHPANLLEELQRDRRWCQGNLQNARLIAEPGWRPVHRVMFAVGALSYLMAPVWLCFVALGIWLSASTASSSGLWILTLLLLLVPRVLGVLAVRLKREQASFGGTAALLGSAALELLLSAVQAPLRMLAHSAFVLGALTGLRLDWKSPSRDALAVAWRDAAAGIGMLALPALALVLLALHGRDMAAPHLAPLLLPLLLAVPFTVWTGGPRLGGVLRRAGLLCVPEERQPPRALSRGTQQQDFIDLAPQPVVAQPRSAGAARRQVMAVAAGLALGLLMLPQTALSPALSPLWHLQAGMAVPEVAPPIIVSSSTDMESTVSPQPPMRTVRYRPASRIDDAVRRRAYESVARSLEYETI